jgi:hypothetical protein
METLRVAGLLIVRMIARGEKTIDAVNGLHLGSGTDLEELVIVFHVCSALIFFSGEVQR